MKRTAIFMVVLVGLSLVNPTVSVAVLYGDADLDGTISASDLNAVLAHYDCSGQSWSAGDFNYDGRVTIWDACLVLSQLGVTTEQGNTPGGGQTYPEQNDIRLRYERTSYGNLDKVAVYIDSLTGPADGCKINIIDGLWTAVGGAFSLDADTTLWPNRTAAGQAPAGTSWINFDSVIGPPAVWDRSDGAASSWFDGVWYTSDSNNFLDDDALLGEFYVTPGAAVGFDGYMGFTEGKGSIEHVVAVPEPSVLAMLVMGLACVIAFASWRGSKQ